jgi:alkanesulfonate monooxygenase SsuD/methylene tetrahydromethanopterin reductase-like flavin-dependent oxidoreductase (luciferase family)
MRVGYFTMPMHPPGSDLAQTLADDLEQLVTLDRLGFSEAWVGEHITAGWENIPCPDLLIAQALALTKNIRLGTGVSCLPNHDPVMLAQRIAQLDQMARGRFAWGIGSGGFVGDFELYDVDNKNLEQRQLTRDILDTVLMLWDDPKPGLYEHPRWRFRVPEPQPDIGLSMHVRPYQRPHPPIAVAGLGPKSDMLTLAGSRGWIPMSINLVPTSTLQAHWQTYAASAEGAGRVANRADWRIARNVYVGETSEQARRDVLDGVMARDFEHYFFPMLRKQKQMIMFKPDNSMPDEAVTLDYVYNNIWIAGDADEVTAKLRRLYDDVGGFGTLLVIGHEWTPKDKWVRSMRRLAEDIIPSLPDVTVAV